MVLGAFRVREKAAAKRLTGSAWLDHLNHTHSVSLTPLSIRNQPFLLSAVLIFKGCQSNRKKLEALFGRFRSTFYFKAKAILGFFYRLQKRLLQKSTSSLFRLSIFRVAQIH